MKKHFCLFDDVFLEQWKERYSTSGHIMPVGSIQNGPELTVHIFLHLFLTSLVGKPEGKKPLGKTQA
jgi:hypothetical protein